MSENPPVDSAYDDGGAGQPVRQRPRGGLTIRLRMTIAYGAAVFLTGLVLILTTYFSVRWRLNHMSGVIPDGCTQKELNLYKDLAVRAARKHACDMASTQEVLKQLDRTLIFVLIIAGVLAGVIGYFLARRFLAPIHKITRTARKVGSRPDRGLHARIDLDGPNDELMELAETFDGMLDRLDQAFEGQRRFVGNASHELRTPLAINRTLLEVTLMDPEAGEQTRQLCRTLLATTSAARR